ncbi:MAG TPA: hypothetical protein DDW52_09800, partial [Planctomycetaceae bacterium]|nr:hypothetical protein [Planctomycetaceae bacterium]
AEQFLWRWRVRRLTAEQLRDSMLVATGELDRKLGGASVETSKPRRSIYLKSFRNKNDTFLHGFDFPPGLRSVAVRDSTTTPTQALLLLNGKFALSRAEKLSKRLLDENAESPEVVIEKAYQSVWSRLPSASEVEAAFDYLSISGGEDRQLPSLDRLTDFCHVLLNSNQFLYLD